MRLEPEFIRNLMRERSPSAAYITALLAPRERSGTRALFSFVSICRDAIDFAGSRSEAQTAIALLTRLFSEGVVQRFANEHSVVDEVIDAVPDFGLAWEAWSFLEEDFEIPRSYAIEFICGLKQDADGYRPETVEDLLRYVYRTGGVLGLMACHIFAAPATIQQAAVDAGSAARLTMIADNIYKDFTLGRCFVPLQWMNYSATQTFAPSWAGEASKRFRLVAEILETSSRSGLAKLPFRNRAAIAAMGVLQRESRSTALRKIDRTADVLIRHAADASWSTILPRLRRVRLASRRVVFAVVDAFDKRSLTPILEMDTTEMSKSEINGQTPFARNALPVRDLATALRNQNILIDRVASQV
jgi:15-cis-phytoene synthase